MSDVRVVRQSCLGGRIASQVEAIYLASFPPCEREAFSELANGVKKGDELAFIAEEGNVVGFALVQRLSGAGVFLLGYMAVAGERRGRGIGSTLLQYVARDLRRRENAEGLLIEVEPPDEGPDDELDLRRRRIEFYRRHGAQVIAEAGSYRMPDLSGEGSLEMRLMWLALGTDGRMLSGQKLRDIIVSIYKDSYGRPEDDPLLRSVLQGMTM